MCHNGKRHLFQHVSHVTFLGRVKPKTMKFVFTSPSLNTQVTDCLDTHIPGYQPIAAMAITSVNIYDNMLLL
jgi:hypothetical protein